MFIAIEYPLGQKATTWNKNIAAGKEALEIIPTTRRLATAVASLYFQTEAIRPEIWGTESLPEEKVEQVQRFIDTLSKALADKEIIWWIPDYSVSSRELFSELNDDSNRRTIKSRWERTVYFSAPLYMEITNDDHATTILEEMEKLPYLGRSESVVVVKEAIISSRDKLKETHMEYLWSENPVFSEEFEFGKISSLELSNGAKLDEIIDVAPTILNSTVAPKKSFPKGCSYGWWFPANKQKRSRKTVASQNLLKRSVQKVFLECVSESIISGELTLNLLNRLSKEKVDFSSMNISPVISDTGNHHLGWEISTSNPIDLLSLGSFSYLTIKNSDYLSNYDVKIHSNRKFANNYGTMFMSSTPAFFENVDTVDDVVSLIETNSDFDVVEVSVFKVVETEIGAGLYLSIRTKNVRENFYVGELNNLGLGHMFAVRSGV